MQEEPALNRTCPHCGAFLHEKASFCPHCAKSLNQRTEPKLPRPICWRALRAGIALLLLLGIGIGIYLHNRPRVYDAKGEVIYADADGTYQVVLAWANNRYEPAYEVHQNAELDGAFRYPVRLYINHVDSGADAGQLFLQKVERVTTEIIQPADSPSPMACTEPAPNGYSPDAALVTFLDYSGRSGKTQLLWTLYLKNGDIIRLRQDEIIHPIQTYNYDSTVAPMDTLAGLQALIDKIADTIEPEAVVNIYLPAVTYEGSLVMERRPVNLYGSTDGGARTTFIDPIRVASQGSWITYIKDVDFIGSGGGIGISASARLWVENCRFTGWKTAVLGYGTAWVNTIECRFENNEVGFHFNSTGASASHTMFNGNEFCGNGTAVLLENVPTDLIMNFQGTLFSENGTDIDNRCNQPLDITEAIFQ